MVDSETICLLKKKIIFNVPVSVGILCSTFGSEYSNIRYISSKGNWNWDKNYNNPVVAQAELYDDGWRSIHLNCKEKQIVEFLNYKDALFVQFKKCI